MEAKQRILVVDDEPQLTRVLRRSLMAKGYDVRIAGDGDFALQTFRDWPPALVITDLAMPNMSGLELCRRLRAISEVPIIVLSVRGEEATKVEALDAGADDYITKPFGVGELLARVRVALRHASRSPAGQVLLLGKAKIELEKRRATRDGVEVHLTPIEFRLLGCLAQHLGMVVTHRQLLGEVWGPSHVEQTHYLRIYMKQLREKLEADPVRPRHLITETGVGYRLVADEV